MNFWQNTAIPATIRRPWDVCHDVLEAKAVEAGALGIEVGSSVSERLGSIAVGGAQAVFKTLAPDEQERFVEASVTELAAYVNWRSHQDGLAHEDGSTFEDVWDNAANEVKIDWIVKAPVEYLAAQGWHPHLASFTTQRIIAEQDLEYEETLQFMEKQSTRN